MSIVLKLKADGKPVLRGHEHYWSVARGLDKANGSFTSRDIMAGSNGATISVVRDFLKRLLKAGYAETFSDELPAKYRLLKRPQHLPPIRRDGTVGQQGLGQIYMWTAIRALKTFTAPELAIAASTDIYTVGVLTAFSYTRLLGGAGYFVVIENGGPNKPTIWRLKPSMNTGPKAPKVLRAKVVFDPNLNEIIGEIIATEAAS